MTLLQRDANSRAGAKRHNERGDLTYLQTSDFGLQNFNSEICDLKSEISHSPLKTEPGRDLEGARPTGSEGLAHALIGLAECGGHNQVVVEVRQVRYVENIEHLADDPQLCPRRQTERFRQP
jgi:hypothetical protein